MIEKRMPPIDLLMFPFTHGRALRARRPAQCVWPEWKVKEGHKEKKWYGERVKRIVAMRRKIGIKEE